MKHEAASLIENRRQLFERRVSFAAAVEEKRLISVEGTKLFRRDLKTPRRSRPSQTDLSSVSTDPSQPGTGSHLMLATAP